MNEPTPTANDGLLARLRGNERINRLSGGKPDLIIFGAPIVLIAIIAAIVVAAVAMGGGGGDEKQVVTTPTSPAATSTAASESTPTPASAGLLTPIAVDPGERLTSSDLAQRGAGPAGRGEFTGERLVIPSIGVDAPFTVKVVPSSGAMPNPNGPDDVVYYDFGGFANLGGAPGHGGNIVLAGHVDYINVGPAVFWEVRNLQAGDIVEIHMSDGSVAQYQVEFNKHIPQDDADWNAIVAGTAQESITLITCTGEFSAGHYADRQIVWGRRIA